MKKVLMIVGIVAVAFWAGNFSVQNSTKESKPQVKGISQEISSVAPDQFAQLAQSGDYVLLDIRTTDEYQVGHIKNAQQIDFYQTQNFSDYLDKLDKNAKYLIYCRSGNRSGQALEIMKNKSFSKVVDLKGGISAWTANGLPIVSGN